MLITASGAVFVGLSVAVRREGPIVGDGAVQFFNAHYYDFEIVRLTIKAITLASIVLGVGFALALFGILVAARAFAAAGFWALAIGGTLSLTTALKELVERPEIGTGQAEYSFPSGNAAVSLAGTLALVFLLGRTRWRRRIAVAGVVLLPPYGIGLVMLLWHYPTDVVGGWALAVGWVCALALVFGRRVEIRGPIVRHLP